MLKLKEKIDGWDFQIKQGDLAAVRLEMGRLPIKKIYRGDRLLVASLFRRVQMFSHAAKVLFPVVRTNETSNVASSTEIAEYSASLLRIGSVLEVKKMLAGITDTTNPEVVLSKAFTEIVSWNYADAALLLQEYLELPNLSQYQLRVAEVNLAAALLSCSRFTESISLLERVILEASRSNLQLIRATCLGYLGTAYAEIGDTKAAKITLQEARKATSTSHMRHHLHMDKLEASINAPHLSREAIDSQYQALKRRAMALEDYEAMRDCDFALAKFTDSKNAFLSYLLGSPYPALRQKAQELDFEVPRWCHVQRHALGSVDSTFEATGISVDILKPPNLKPSQCIHRSIIALNLDFYRPQSIGGFHECVYPETYFDPYSAPTRIHTAISRLRSWLDQQDWGWKILTGDKGLELVTSATMPLKIPLENEFRSMGTLEIILNKLRIHFSESSFTAEAALALRLCGRRKLYQLLSDGVERGLLVRSGGGRYSMYRLVSRGPR